MRVDEMQMDEIRIENLKVYAHHGVYAHENEDGQNFYINAILYTDTKKAGVMDDLDLSTNYGEICQYIGDFMVKHTYKLIETVAEKCAEGILLQFPLVRKIALEVRKPEAPIPMEFESVSVRIQRGWNRAYIACGSNMGDKEKYLINAVDSLKADEKCRVRKVSDFVTTTPYGGVEQDNFLNGAIEIETLYSPEELLLCLQEIEKENGRVREIHWGPRTLDLDILLYENRVIHSESLIVPHVDMQNRDFVLVPLAQIAAYEMHPILQKPICILLSELKQNGETHVTG